MNPRLRAEWDVLSEELCILSSCFLSPMSKSVCNDCEHLKNDSTDGDAVWVVDSGGTEELCVKRESRSPMERGTFEWGMTSRFSRTHVLSSSHAGISPHAVDQRSDWPAAQKQLIVALNFPNEKPLRCGLWSKLFDHLLVIIIKGKKCTISTYMSYELDYL